MSDILHLNVPFTKETALSLRAGQKVFLSGVIFGARDAAHKRFAEVLECQKELPVDLHGQVIYYVGPAPAPPGRVCGSAGPTTSSRMDAYTPLMLAYGVLGLIGKGNRSPEVISAIKKHEAVYFAATGGAGALLARCVKGLQVIAYPELGPEAVYRFLIENFPAVVAIDCQGRNIYNYGPSVYRKK